ncbi:ankyrin repeat domain-containing protein [Rickettsiales bacterium]|nr:ankyrin repeat domain-containing protein [Rickettsiales bacterium]
MRVISIFLTATLFLFSSLTFSYGYRVSFHNSLVDAADSGDAEMVAHLLKKGASPDSRGDFNVTALMRAAYNGNKGIVKMLLKSGAYVNAADIGGATALHLAARQGHVDVVKTLIDYDAVIDIPDKEKWTPLMRATMAKQVEAVDLLVKNGADVTRENQLSESALLHSAMVGLPSLVEIITGSESFKDISDAQTETAVNILRKNNNKETEVLLSRAISDNRKFLAAIDSKSTLPNSAPSFLVEVKEKENGDLNLKKFNLERFEKTLEKEKVKAPVEAPKIPKISSDIAENKKLDLPENPKETDKKKTVKFLDSKEESEPANPTNPTELAESKNSKADTKSDSDKPDLNNNSASNSELHAHEEARDVDGMPWKNKKENKVQEPLSVKYIQPVKDPLFYMQLGAFDSEDQALYIWNSLKNSNPDLLGNLSYKLVKATLSPVNKEVVRLRAGVGDVRSDAEKKCDNLRQRNIECFVVERPKSRQKKIESVQEKLLKESYKDAKKSNVPSPVARSTVRMPEAENMAPIKVDPNEVLPWKVSSQNTKIIPEKNKISNIQREPNNYDMQKYPQGYGYQYSKNPAVNSAPALESQGYVPKSIPQFGSNSPYSKFEKEGLSQKTVDSSAAKSFRQPPPQAAAKFEQTNPQVGNNGAAPPDYFRNNYPQNSSYGQNLSQQPLETNIPRKEYIGDNLPNIDTRDINYENKLKAAEKEITMADRENFFRSQGLEVPQAKKKNYGDFYQELQQKDVERSGVSEAVLVADNSYFSEKQNQPLSSGQQSDGDWVKIGHFSNDAIAADYWERMFRYDEMFSRLQMSIIKPYTNNGIGQVFMKIGPLSEDQKMAMCGIAKSSGLKCVADNAGDEDSKYVSTYKKQENSRNGSASINKQPVKKMPSFWIQLGTFSDKPEAEYYWMFLMEDNYDIIGNLEYNMPSAGGHDAFGDDAVQLRVGPFGVSSRANQICDLLRFRNIACLVSM